MQSLDAKLCTLVDSLYASISSPSLIGEFLRNMTNMLDTTSTSILQFDTRAGISQLSDGFFREFGNDTPAALTLLGRYATEFAVHNPFPAIAHQMGQPGALLLSDELMPRSAFTKTIYFNEFFRPLRWDDHCALLAQRSSTSMQWICLSFNRYCTETDSPHFQLLRMLGPHVARAFQIRDFVRGVDLDREAAWSALELLPFGIVIIDQNKSPRYISRIAEQLLDANDGLNFTNGCIGAAIASEDAALKAAIAASVMASCRRDTAYLGDAVSITRQGHRRPLSVVLAPIRVSMDVSGLRRPASILFICDPARRVDIPLARLKTLFGLTNAEARLASAIASGLSVQECANEFNHSLNTTRSLLKGLFSKTDTRRKGELAALILSLNLNVAGVQGEP